MDVKIAFLQALCFARTIYVRPQHEAEEKVALWLLIAEEYVLTESESLWYLTSNEKLRSRFGLSRYRYDYTLYYSRNEAGVLYFFLAVQVDDFTYTGKPSRCSHSKLSFKKHSKSVNWLAKVQILWVPLSPNPRTIQSNFFRRKDSPPSIPNTSPTPSKNHMAASPPLSNQPLIVGSLGRCCTSDACQPP